MGSIGNTAAAIKQFDALGWEIVHKDEIRTKVAVLYLKSIYKDLVL